MICKRCNGNGANELESCVPCEGTGVVDALPWGNYYDMDTGRPIKLNQPCSKWFRDDSAEDIAKLAKLFGYKPDELYLPGAGSGNLVGQISGTVMSPALPDAVDQYGCGPDCQCVRCQDPRPEHKVWTGEEAEREIACRGLPEWWKENSMIKCKRCNGTGKIARFSHIENGKCFNCNGTGNIPGGEEKTMQSFAEFPFELQPNPNRADYRPAPSRVFAPAKFDTVRVEVDERLASCRNVVVTIHVGQSMVFESPLHYFKGGEIKLVCPVTVLPNQDIYVHLSWDVGDDWYRLDQRTDPLRGKVVLPYWTVESEAPDRGEKILRDENRALRERKKILRDENCVLRDRNAELLKENKELREHLDNYEELVIKMLRNEIRALRAERPRTGLADVPEYRPGVSVRCQNDEDGGY